MFQDHDITEEPANQADSTLPTFLLEQLPRILLQVGGESMDSIGTPQPMQASSTPLKEILVWEVVKGLSRGAVTKGVFSTVYGTS